MSKHASTDPVKLDRPADAGARHCAAARLAQVKTAADAVGFPYAHLDIAAAQDTDDLLAALALALHLPDYFGGNWDALADCLCDLSWKPAPGYVLVIEGYDSFRGAHPREFDTLLEICNEAADYWREEDVAFWTLLTEPKTGAPFLPQLA